MTEHLRWLEELRKRAFGVSGVPDVLSGPASLSSAAAIRERLDCDPLTVAWKRLLASQPQGPGDGNG